MTLKTILWRTFSETDERYLDLFRVGYAAGVAVFLGLSVWAMASGQDWDPVDFGAGFGAVLLLGGAGVGIRGRLEDGPTNESPDGAASRVGKGHRVVVPSPLDVRSDAEK